MDIKKIKIYKVYFWYKDASIAEKKRFDSSCAEEVRLYCAHSRDELCEVVHNDLNYDLDWVCGTWSAEEQVVVNLYDTLCNISNTLGLEKKKHKELSEEVLRLYGKLSQI